FLRSAGSGFWMPGEIARPPFRQRTRLPANRFRRALLMPEHRAQRDRYRKSGPERIFRFAGARLRQFRRQHAGIRRNLNRLSDPHFPKIVSELLPTIETNDICSTL